MSTEVSLPGSGLVFDNTYSGLTSVEIQAALDAENYFQGKFNNSVVMNLTFSLGPVGGAAASEFMAVPVYYGWLRSALLSHATTAEAITAAGTLPTTPPSSTFYLTQAMADILGLSNAPVRGTVTINNIPGVIDLTSLTLLTGLFEHEISEEMGRISGLGDQNGIWGPMDLFRYNAAGAHDYTDGRDGAPTYLSLDGGKTVLTDYVFTNNYISPTVRTGNAIGLYDDPDDWSSAPTVDGLGDAFGSENFAGMAVSSTDLSIMNDLGWTPYAAPPSPPVVILAGTPWASNTATARLGTAAPATGTDAVSVALISDADFVTGSTLVLTNGILVYTPGVVTTVLLGIDTLRYTVTDTVTGAATTETQAVRLSNGPPPVVTSDILWHAGNGATATTVIQNSAQNAWQDDGVIPAVFQAAATGDFNGNGSGDILWRASNGDTAIADMEDGLQIGWVSWGLYPTAFTAVGSGDFNGDGTSDILWHEANGDTAISTITDSQQTAWTDLGLYPADFQVAGIGDFNGDGTSDILWRAGNGDTAISTMQDSAQIRWTDLGMVPMAFQVAGVGDFNGDGTSDILWHAGNGDTAISTMQNDAQIKWTDFGIVPADFQVAQIGDFNGDGTSDILWRASDGDAAISTMQNDAQIKWTDLGIVPPAFHVVSN